MAQRISERELEDFICEYPDYVFGDGARIVGRQIPLAHGILDLLVWNDNYGSIEVVELKARPIVQKDIAQVSRYFLDVWKILSSVEVDELMAHPMPFSLSTQWQRIFSPSWNGLGDGKMLPILVGPSIEDNAVAAAHGAGCPVLLWTEVEDGFTFNYLSNLSTNTKSERRYPRWALTLRQLALDFCAQTGYEVYSELNHHHQIVDGLLKDEAGRGEAPCPADE